MANKFNAKRTVGFDSKREAKVYDELRIKELAAEISDLKRLDRYKDYFVLQEGFHHKNAFIVSKNGTKAMPKIREIKYTADFTYLDKMGKMVVVEIKGKATAKEPAYVLRKKLFLKQNPDIIFIEWF